MESYHIAWLSAHPERTTEWLSDRLKDGFHVHHMDGNHSNDEPRNLVLIESGDHMMIHNGSSRLIWRPPVRQNGGRRKKKSPPTIEEMKQTLAAAEEKYANSREGRKKAKAREKYAKQRDAGRERFVASLKGASI